MKYLLIIVALTTLSSCLIEVDADIVPFEKKPVVNCLFSPQKKFVVNVSFPRNAVDKTVTYITSASVYLTFNNQKLTLHHIGKGNYTTENFRPQKGVLYTLSIKVDGFPEVSASDSIPSSTTRILKYKMKTATIQDEYLELVEAGTVVNQLTITIEDPPKSSNLYGLGLKKKSKKWYYELDSYHPAILAENMQNFDSPYILFNDNTFNGRHETIDFIVYTEEKLKFQAEFLSLSPTAFQFIRSSVIHRGTSEYDFWEIYEPLPIYGNITNGYGIFAGYSRSQYEFSSDSSADF